MNGSGGNTTATPKAGKEQEYVRNKISREQLISLFFKTEKRVKELEEIVLKQQKNVIIAEDVPIKIQIHQEEIRRLKGENKRLQLENRNLKRGSGR